jgi:hypothetical protein
MSLTRRDLSPARLVRRVRLVVARRPWVRWLAVVVLATAAGGSVHTRLQSFEAARAQWTEQRRVPVALARAAPGEVIVWEWRELPAVGIPDRVAPDIAPGALARQQVGVGEIIVDADLAVGPGPAAGASPGHVVVPVSDPLVTDAAIGLEVAIYSDGLVLADAARIVAVAAEVVFVEVSEPDAPLVAFAAQTRQASIGFLAPR